MHWEQKVEMVTLLNTHEYEQALDIVIDNIAFMDEQAWDMFFDGVLLTKESINPFIDKHKVIFHKAKNLKSDSIKTAIRIGYYNMLVQEILSEK